MLSKEIIDLLEKRVCYLKEATKTWSELSINLDKTESERQNYYSLAKEHKARLEECEMLLRKVRGSR